jgi:hypothetical protein
VTVLDDAQRLLDEMEPGLDGLCHFCYGTAPRAFGRIEHQPGCVYLRRARIIAALEAAQDAYDDFMRGRDGVPDYGTMSALGAALKGEPS